MRLLPVFFTILLLSTACSPSRTIVNIKETDDRVSFNSKIENKSLMLSLRSGQIYKPTHVRFDETHVNIILNNRAQSIPLTDVRSLRVTKNPAILRFISIPTFGFGLYNMLIVTPMKHNSTDSIGSFFDGLILVAISPIIYISGSNIETTIYYFDWDE
jgi:hypothetical protein